MPASSRRCLIDVRVDVRVAVAQPLAEGAAVAIACALQHGLRGGVASGGNGYELPDAHASVSIVGGKHQGLQPVAKAAVP